MSDPAAERGVGSDALGRLDVVVVTHNSARHLDRALGALAPHVSVTVVDNASHDGSVEVAEAHGAAVVANPVNAGFASAANQGAATGSRPLVLFLNPDAVVQPSDLGRLVAALDDDPQLAVVSPRLVSSSGQAQRASWPLPSAAAAWREALVPEGLRGAGSVVSPGGASRRRAKAPSFVVGACFLVRRAAFEAAGGFDTRFWLYGEEADLCGRLSDGGWRVAVVDDAVAVHEGGASAEGIEELVFEHFQRGPEHVVAKRGGGREVLSMRVAELLGSSIRAALPGSPERRAYHRRRLGRLRRVLRRQPWSVPLDSPATAAEGAGLVVCSLEAWDEIWRRNQFFVRELLAADPNRRVLFVEPAHDVLHERRRGSGRRHQRGLRPLPEDGRIVRLQPVKVWPRVLGPFADRSLRRQVVRAATSMGFVRPDLWINDASHAGLVDATDWPATYDVTDDWTEAGGPSRLRERVTRRESHLLDRSGAVVVCSEQLARSRRAARPDLVVIPNAVDVAHFTRPRGRPDDLPASPVAVYVGTLHDDRLDVDLVGRLARARPDLSIALVGPDSLSAAAHDALARHANVKLLGPRPYGDVPAYLQHADVVVVPHLRNAFTESLDPIKAYECLAVGRPTVATPVAGFRGLGAPVVCAEDDAFVAAVERAVRTEVASDPATPGGGPAAAMASWAARAGEFATCLASARSAVDARPLRVVYLDHCARLSGGELALVRMVAALRRARGIEAHVVLGEDGPLVARLEAVGAAVEIQALDERVASVPRARVTAAGLGASRATAAARDTIALTRRITDLHPDLVHTNSLKAALYGGIAARASGVPVVWHIRDRIAPDYLPPAAVRLVQNLARWVPAAVIVPSRATSDTIAGALGPGRPCHVIHDMVEPVEIPAAVGDHPFRVVMIGRLAPWKGQHVLLDAFAEAFRDEAAELVLVGSAMFGEDDYEAELHHQVERLDMGGRVRFAGFVEDVAGELAEADCVVHASVLAEPFGQVVVEAMAAGRAVVASDLGGPREIVTDGVDGLLCPPGDPTALAERLRRLAHDPALRASLGAAAILRARDFSPEVVAPRIAAAYDEVLALRRVAGGPGR